MTTREVQMVASVKALLRGEVSVRGVAERFGVTESEVRAWKDVFVIAGATALADVIRGQQRGCNEPNPRSNGGGGLEPTTTPMPETTRTPETTPPTEDIY